MLQARFFSFRDWSIFCFTSVDACLQKRAEEKARRNVFSREIHGKICFGFYRSDSVRVAFRRDRLKNQGVPKARNCASLIDPLRLRIGPCRSDYGRVAFRRGRVKNRSEPKAAECDFLAHPLGFRIGPRRSDFGRVAFRR